jgi:aryl-alcohol dehydrogenase-like predicted oxidoreductase
MQYRPLGRTGVSVSKLCLGTTMLGAWGNPDHDESIRIIHAALDAGINFIDTAHVYSQGESEEIVAKVPAGGKRDDVVVATKGAQFADDAGITLIQLAIAFALNHPAATVVSTSLGA